MAAVRCGEFVVRRVRLQEKLTRRFIPQLLFEPPFTPVKRCRCNRMLDILNLDTISNEPSVNIVVAWNHEHSLLRAARVFTKLLDPCTSGLIFIRGRLERNVTSDQDRPHLAKACKLGIQVTHHTCANRMIRVLRFL